MSKKQIIHVCGFRKSGTTHLTRLLGEILDSPTGGSIPSEDSKELATEGLNRTGNYIIRKGHYKIVPEFQNQPHTITLDQIKNNPVFFIIRDPRDICVSAAYFHNRPFGVIAHQMITGKFYEGRWDDYIKSFYLNKLVYGLRYEDLLANTALEIRQGLLWHNLPFNKRKLSNAIQNQSFTTVKDRYKSKPLNDRLMRKGVSGQWQTELPKSITNRLEHEFGAVMEMLEYI